MPVTSTAYICSKTNQATAGWHLVGVGVAGFFFVPTSRVWGKRHAYIIATLLLIGSSIWGGAAQGHKSLLWSRVVQGFAVAPFEALGEFLLLLLETTCADCACSECVDW